MAAIGRVLLMPKGTYSGSAIYNALDWVRDNGQAWVCKVDGTQGITPVEGANWTLMASDGSVSGAVDWVTGVNNKPFTTIDTTDFNVTAQGKLELAGGAGVTTFAGLDDTDITNPQPDQIVQYKAIGGVMKLQNVNMPAGGHTMIDNSTYLSTMKANSQDPTDDKVASTYAISNWSNAEIITLYTTIAKDTDTVGAWNDAWETDGIRTGWLWHSALYDILSDDEVELEFVFDIADREAVNIYAYRVDDAVQQTIGGQTVNGGAIAIKLNGPIQNASGVKIGVNLKRQRTMVDNLTVI